jgi:uncharacterized protein
VTLASTVKAKALKITVSQSREEYINMIDGMFVIDGVVHAYNWAEPNHKNEWSPRFSTAGWGLHTLMSPPSAYTLSPEEFIRDWDIDVVAYTLFAESDVDMGVYHATPLTDYYKDGLVGLDKGVEMKKRYPNRVRLYGTINPLEGNKALEDMEYQVKELGVDGIKLYPARYSRGRTLPEAFNDPQFGFPMLEKAQELGVKSVAVHKAIPFGPTSGQYYRMDDLDEAAACFPNVNIEVVHAGFAFLEETCFLLGRFPNVYANFEVTMSLLINNPRKFAEVLGMMLYWGAGDRIIFGSGCSFVHPQPVIEAFMKFEMPQDLVEGYAYPQITNDIRANILGGNLARLLGINLEEQKALIANDEFAKAKAGGKAEAWSHLRKTLVNA